jgi:predicted P-loop ATPase
MSLPFEMDKQRKIKSLPARNADPDNTGTSNTNPESNGNSDFHIIERELQELAQFRYNTITGMPELLTNKGKDWEPMTDRSLNILIRALKRKGTKAASAENIKRIISSDFSPAVDPICQYFKNSKFEKGSSQILALASTVTLKPETDEHRYLFETCLKKWLVGSVANVFDKKVCRNHFCFVLTGAQGTYKSTWINQLSPKQLERYYYEGGVDPDNKDDLLATTTNFIFNLDDYLASVTAKKINEFKGFITKNTVKVRLPYGTFPEERPKVCNFIGSSNETEFLHDPTGNRRFLPFEVADIDINEAQAIDIDQVWAEAYQLFEQGYKYWLTDDIKESLAEHNEQFEVQHKEYELVIEYFRHPADNDRPELMNPTQIQSYLQNQSGLRTSKRKTGEALKKAGFERQQRRINGQRAWVYALVKVPPEDRGVDDDQVDKGEKDDHDNAPF